MLSPQTLSTLAKLYHAQDSYQPAPAVAKQLQDKTVVMLVGATCVGKNTIMETACRLDSRFHICGRFTSRELRASDDPSEYTYYPNTDTGLAPLLQRISNHQVVQYAINPHANLIYGTDIDDYAADYNLSDIFAFSVDAFRRLPFKRTVVITVVSEPNIWLERVNERFPQGDPQRSARLQEAAESLRWSLAQSDDDHFWVGNIDGDPEKAARDVMSIAFGTGAGQPHFKTEAEACLQALQRIEA